jgi:hypothetical protein
MLLQDLHAKKKSLQGIFWIPEDFAIQKISLLGVIPTMTFIRFVTGKPSGILI